MLKGNLQKLLDKSFWEKRNTLRENTKNQAGVRDVKKKGAIQHKERDEYVESVKLLATIFDWQQFFNA